MRRSSFFLSAPLAACLLLSQIPLAHAGDPRTDAEARQEEGIKRYRAGDPDGARNAFKQAYAIFPSPKILWNLSIAEMDSGKSLDAARHIHIYMASKEASVTEEKKSLAAKRLAEARQKLGAVQIEAPQGARIFIDGEAFPQGYAESDIVELEPGAHRVLMETAASRKERGIVIKIGEVSRVSFMEAEPPPAAALAPVQQKPGKSQDQKDQGSSSDGSDRAGGLACPKSGACLGTTIGLGVLGIGGLVGGIVFNSSAKSAADEARALVTNQGGTCIGNTSADCQRVGQLKDDNSSRETLSTVSFIAGGTLVAAAAVVFFVWPKSTKAQSARAFPMVTRDSVGMGLGGTF